MEVLKGNDPAAKRVIEADDKWYFQDTVHVSNSMLKVFQNDGIKNYDAYLQGKLRKESAAFNIGSAFHCLILEGTDVFNERYYVWDDSAKCIEISGEDWKEQNKKPRGTKAYKEWYAEEIAPIEANPDITMISADEFETIMKMEEALFNVPEAINLIKACNAYERIYTNEINGIKTKCKVDGIKYDDFIIDLKTTDSSVKEFIKSCYKYKYDQQAAFYTDTVDVKRLFFVVVEKKFPYNVGVFIAGESFLERGREAYTIGLNDLSYFLGNKEFVVDNFYFRDTLY